jgi:large subunit ribosomal protein L31
MKKDIHPKWYPDAKIICNGEVIMTVGSTKPELSVEIWSGNHPFYTGQQRLVDTEGQVERFMKRLQRREEIKSEADVEADLSSPLLLEIDEIDLNTRSMNALKSEGLETVGHVHERLLQSDDALLSITGVGQKALIDIKKYFRANGLID